MIFDNIPIELNSSEELEGIHTRYSWGEITNEQIRLSKEVRPVICYHLIDLSLTKYHFHQECFDNEDIKAYFECLRYISSNTIDDLIENSDHKLHFHRTDYNTNYNLRTEIKKIYNAKEINPEKIGRAHV